MRIIGYRPTNAWIERQLDRRWTRWLTWCAAVGVVTAAALGSFVAPHQEVVRLRYVVAQLTAEVERLEREQRTLLVEREKLTSIPHLAEAAATLGLAPVPVQRTLVLLPDGSLLPLVPSAPDSAASEVRR